MAGKVGCGLTLTVLFAIAAISRAPVAVLLLALGLAWFLYRTRAGLVLRAVARQRNVVTAAP